MKKYIKAKYLIDGTGGPVRENPVIVVEDGMITKVDTAENIPIPDHAEVLDMGEGTLMPGMIDSHSHAGQDYNREETIRDQHLMPEGLRVLRGYNSLKRDLMSGVTTVRLLGDGQGCIDKILRDAINAGEIVGPRLLVACQAIRPRHGTAPEISACADGVDEVRRRVREAIFLGADVIKIFVSNISNGDTFLDYLRGDLTKVPAYTKEEIAVAVEEAHRVGIKVAAHCIGGPAVRWSLEVGVDSLEHVNLIDEDDIPYFLEYGGYISDPNLILFFDPVLGYESPLNKTHKLEDLPRWWQQKVKMTKEQTKRVMSKALQAGVKFALGTDPNHGLLHLECKYFVEEIGATPMQAILAVTRDSAELMGLADQIGTIEEGKLADIIALRANPLDDINNLRDVIMVMKEGQLVKESSF